MEPSEEFNSEGAQPLLTQLDRTDARLARFAADHLPFRERKIALRARRQIRRIKHWVISHHWKVICAEVAALLALLKLLATFQGDVAELTAIVTAFGCALMV